MYCVHDTADDEVPQGTLKAQHKGLSSGRVLSTVFFVLQYNGLLVKEYDPQSSDHARSWP